MPPHAPDHLHLRTSTTAPKPSQRWPGRRALLRQPTQVAPAHHHVRWQVYIGEHSNQELWADMPMAMSNVLEMSARSGANGPIIFSTAPGYAYTLGDSPAQTNREARTVRQMRRAIICDSSAQRLEVA